MRDYEFPPMPDWFPDFVRELAALSPAALGELNAMLAEDDARAEAAKCARARDSDKQKRQRKPREPLASAAKQASKAGIAVARYEVRSDGTVVVVTGKSEATEPDPWLDDLKVTKQ
jgi:L-lactate utilization protein LutC